MLGWILCSNSCLICLSISAFSVTLVLQRGEYPGRRWILPSRWKVEAPLTFPTHLCMNQDTCCCDCLDSILFLTNHIMCHKLLPYNFTTVFLNVLHNQKKTHIKRSKLVYLVFIVYLVILLKIIINCLPVLLVRCKNDDVQTIKMCKLTTHCIDQRPHGKSNYTWVTE